MATNQEDGCGIMTSVGPCDRVCDAGFCGVNIPAQEERGASNVLMAHMHKDHGIEVDSSDSTTAPLKIILPVVFGVFLIVCFVLAVHNNVMKICTKTKTSGAKQNDCDNFTVDAKNKDVEDQSSLQPP